MSNSSQVSLILAILRLTVLWATSSFSDISSKVYAERNLVFSPHSVSTGMGMAYAGASGKTAVEIVVAADLPPNDPQDIFLTLSEALEQSSRGDGCVLQSANRLWGAIGQDYAPNFLSTLRTGYKAELFTLDFAGDPAAAVKVINAWVSEQTAGHIRQLASRRSVDRDTLLVLTNAIYFRGAWAMPFLPESTDERLFHVSADKTVPARMMHQYGSFSYLETPDVKLLELPYRGRRLAFIALLPNGSGGLAQLESRLTARQIRDWLYATKRTGVNVSLPKFEASTTTSLKDVLKRKGIVSAFDVSAYFSKICGKSNLYLSDVAHQAYINVHEKGTEAAASTSVLVRKGVSDTAVNFRADRPFVYMIVDRPTGAILFLGHVVAPDSNK